MACFDCFIFIVEPNMLFSTLRIMYLLLVTKYYVLIIKIFDFKVRLCEVYVAVYIFVTCYSKF